MRPSIQLTVAKFGVEQEGWEGTLITEKQVDKAQTKQGALYEGLVPTETGYYHGYYLDVAKAIRGEMKQYVTAETARNNIRIIELARESWKTGRVMPFDAM